MDAPTIFDGLAVVISAGALLYAMLGKRDDRDYTRFAGYEPRIAMIEKTMITRAELMDSNDRNTADRHAMHNENQASLDRIENKLDIKEGSDKDSRHDLGNKMAAAVLRIQALEIKLEALLQRLDER